MEDFDNDFENDLEQDLLSKKDVLKGVEFEWAENMPTIDYSSLDFSKEIGNKLRGITVEDFKEECQAWFDAIKILPSFDEGQMRKEINSWDLDLPEQDNYNLDSIYVTYANYVRYRNRIRAFVDVVNAHSEILTTAQKCIKEMAVKLAEGAKHDKDAVGTFYTNRLSIAIAQAKRVATFLDYTVKTIEFNSLQMERLYRERLAIAKINNGMYTEGASISYDSPTRSIDVAKTPSRDVRINSFNYNSK
jgi:hypothetical protein